MFRQPGSVVWHVVRYDDVAAGSNGEIEHRVVEILLRHEVPCTFSVIPFACDPQSLLNSGRVVLRPFPPESRGLLQPLLDAGLAEIALHGYAHLMLSGRRDHQEFSDAMPDHVQRDLIRSGRAHLEQVFQSPVRVFVPPWNRLARSTLRVLQEEGMLLSASMAGLNGAKEHLGRHVPCDAAIPNTLPALVTAQRFARGAAVVGTVIHDYDFRESGYVGSITGMTEFEQALERWIALPGIRRCLLSAAIEEQHASGGRTHRNTRLHDAVRRSRLGRRILRHTRAVYWDEATAQRLTRYADWLP